MYALKNKAGPKTHWCIVMDRGATSLCTKVCLAPKLRAKFTAVFFEIDKCDCNFAYVT